MKNKLFSVMFALPVTAGICGALLRSWQIRYAYDAETGILQSGNLITYGLVAVCVIAALMAVIAAFLLKRGLPLPADKTGSISSAALSVAAVVVLAYAGMIFWSLREGFSGVQLVLALFSVYCSVALLVMGKYRMQERDSTAYCVFSAVPVFWACFMLILTFREKIADPIIANYVPLILSYISILFFCYSIAAHVLGKNKKHVAVFSCFIGVFFMLLELISFFASNGAVGMSLEKVREMLPLVAFLVLMPATCAEIVRK
ncbi:MAG: hypothetical protein II996_01450 [Oscillospiraceae bacterium]|nr:hypothetical protein [Oscillospiraceae bacterium]